MGYIGQAPANKAVTSADIEDSAITSAKILDGTIANADVNDLASSKLTGALPAISGASLTALNATNLGSGTVPDARFGTLPAVSGVNLTALNATNLGSGTVPTARLGTGTANSTVHLRGDGTWAAAGGTAGTEIVYADRSGNQSSIADNTWTKIEFNTEQYDPDSNWDTTNDKFIAPSAGRYCFYAQAYGWGRIYNAHAVFYVNGSSVNDSYWIDNMYYANEVCELTFQSTALFNLSASDYVEWYLKADVHSGSLVVDQVGTQFLAYRLD